MLHSSSGQAAEHEISILSARNVLLALDRCPFQPVLIGVDKTGRRLTKLEATGHKWVRTPGLPDEQCQHPRRVIAKAGLT